VQESIYESCLVSNRKQVHRSLAKYYELENSAHLSKVYGIIAHHYLAAEDWPNACLYLELSAEASEKLEMHGAVVDALTQWLDIKEKKLALDSSKKERSAINGRFGSAQEEEGMVRCKLGNSYHEINEMALAFTSLSMGAAMLKRPFPASTLRKLAIFASGITHLQYTYITGGALVTKELPSEVNLVLNSATQTSACVRERKGGGG
jgi:hypothetical protein